MDAAPVVVNESEYVNGRLSSGVIFVWLSRIMSPVLLVLKLETLTGVFVTCKVLSSGCFCEEKQTTETASSFFCRMHLKYFLCDDVEFFTGEVP